MGHVAQAIRKRCSGPAIFSLARTSVLEESSITLNKGLCTQGHIRLNEEDATMGVFLTISQDLCAQWCAHHEVSQPPV